MEVEAQLDALDEEARNAQSMDVQEALQCWETLTENAKIESSVEKELLQKLEESHTVLKEYCKFTALCDNFSVH